MSEYTLEDPFVGDDKNESKSELKTKSEELEVENKSEDTEIEDTEIEETDKFKTKTNQVYVEFKNNASSIECVITATNTKYNVIANNKELRLLQNRFYFIPVSTDLNTDEFENLKILSDIAEKIDVRYIKDGFACVMALKHNVLITNGQRLCVVW